MISLQPNHLRRYKDVARLLYKYGCGDLVRSAGLDAECSVDGDESASVDGPASPGQLAADLEQLGPVFIKLGQLLSTRSELLPPEYLEALTRLQDGNEAVPWPQIREVMVQQYGADPNLIFASINEKPAATASLGQVHHATLRDGREVVIKVQRPSLQPDLDDDLASLEELASILHTTTAFGRKYQLVHLVTTLKKSILSELDYCREAENAERLKENLKSFESLVIPKPITDLCRQRVMVMERVSGTKITDLSPVVLLELDGKKLADEIFEAYLHQVLVDGHFHADPHPGNLWLDRDHRIALLDFGLVVHVTPAMRQDLLKLLLAVGEGDSAAAAQLADRSGEKTSTYDADQLHRLITDVFAKNHGASLQQADAGQIIMSIQRAACEAGLILPDAVTMLGKTLVNLDKVVKVLDCSFNPTEAIERHANAIMQQHGSRQLSLRNAYRAMVESAEMIQHLPSRMNEISRRVAESDFTVRVESMDEDKIIAGMQKIANRITAGLIIAALVMAASQLMSVPSNWTMYGYPALALVFFVLSTVLGGFVLWQILVTDRTAS